VARGAHVDRAGVRPGPVRGTTSRASWGSTSRSKALGAHTVEVVLIPHDCADGFLTASRRRPEAYPDPAVRRGISTFSLRTEEQLRPGLQRLAGDIASGGWHERHADLLARDELDLGHRLLVAGQGSTSPRRIA
jgi:hypothetical protein